MRVVPLRRPSGGAIIVCTDTTRERVARRRARALSRLLLAAQESERRSIARELHDDVTQQIAAAALDLSVLLPRLPAGREEVCAEVARIVERLRRLSSSVHGLSRRMHPHALEVLGLGRALEGECRSFAERTGIGMTARIHAGDPTIPAPVALAVFRVCQEALNNVARHARATSVRVELDRSVDELRLSVRDTGVGFDVSRSHRGIGLPGMKERALAVGGRLSVASATGRGAAIRLSVPLFREQEP
jgi:signal transduction histidine kinase